MSDNKRLLFAFSLAVVLHASAAGAILRMEKGTDAPVKEIEKLTFRVEEFTIEKEKPIQKEQFVTENPVVANEPKREVIELKQPMKSKSVPKQVKLVKRDELPFALSGLEKGQGVETPVAEQDLIAGNPEIAVEKDVEYQVIQESALPPPMQRPEKVDIVLPLPKKVIKGKYPKGAHSSGVAEVKLRLLIDSRGFVASVEIVKGSDFELFDNEAVELVKSYEFHPAKKNGKPVEYSIPWTVRFIPE